jgi:hypothetical protein
VLFFSKTGNFNLAKKRLVDKAVVSIKTSFFNMFSKNFIHLISKFCGEYKWCDKLYIMHDILDCFPQIMFAQKEIILIFMLEKVHLKFCKMILNLKTSTPNYMIYGESGRYPVEIDIKIRIISFWAKIIRGIMD